jgi:putative ubiquitin-RnfH superfamily antitoxin RatB of RatAB toxin-antitoxin module
MAKRRCVWTLTLSNGEEIDFTRRELLRLFATGGIEQIAQEKGINLSPDEVSNIKNKVEILNQKLKDQKKIATQEKTALKKDMTAQKQEIRKRAAERLKAAVEAEKAKTSEVREKAKTQITELKGTLAEQNKQFQEEKKNLKKDLEMALNLGIKEEAKKNVFKTRFEEVRKALSSAKGKLKTASENLERFRAAKDVVTAFLDSGFVKQIGSVSSKTANKLAKMAANATTEAKLNNFIEYLDKVLNNAAFADKMDRIDSAKKSALKGRHYKFETDVRRFAAVNLFGNDGQLILSDADIEAYLEALEDLGKKIPDHTKMYAIDSAGDSLFDRVVLARMKEDAKINESERQFTEQNGQAMFDQLSSLLEDKEITDIDEYKDFMKVVNSAKKVLDKMYDQGIVGDEEYDNLLEQIYKIEDGKRKFEEERQEEIKWLKNDAFFSTLLNLDSISQSPDVLDNLTPLEKEVYNELLSAANEFKNSIYQNYESLNGVELVDLEKLAAVTESIANGFVPLREAMQLTTKLKAVREYKGQDPFSKKSSPSTLAQAIANQIIQMGERTLSLTSRFAKNKQALKLKLQLNDSAKAEKLLGIAKSSALTRGIFAVTDRAIQQYETFVNDTIKAFAKASGNNTLKNRLTPLKLSIPGYLIGAENDVDFVIRKDVYNSVATGVIGYAIEHGFDAVNGHPQVDFLKRAFEDLQLMQSISNEKEKPGMVRSAVGILSGANMAETMAAFTVYQDLVAKFPGPNNTLDYKALFEAYKNDPSSVFGDSTQADMYEALREAFNKSGDVVMGSQALRGQKGLVNPYYMPHVYSSNVQPGQEELTRGKAAEGVKRAGASFERTSRVPLKGRMLSFNVDKVLADHVEEVGKDFFLHKALSEVNEMFKEVRRFTPVKYRNALQGFREYEVSRLNYQIRSGSTIPLLEKSQAALETFLLSNPVRIGSELAANTAQIGVAADFKFGQVYARSILKGSEDGKLRKGIIDIMKFTNSPLLDKIEGIGNRSAYLYNSRIKEESRLKKIEQFSQGMSDILLTPGFWYVKFNAEFKNITGENWDPKFLNDRYQVYRQAIMDAAAVADMEVASVIRGTKKAQRRQLVRWVPLSSYIPGLMDAKWTTTAADSTQGRSASMFTNYLYSDKGDIEALLTRGGTKDFKDAATKASRVSTNTMMYAIASLLLGLLWKSMTGDDEEKEKAKKELQNISTNEGLNEFLSKVSKKMTVDLVSGPEGGIGKGLGFLAAEMMYLSSDNSKNKKEWGDFIKDNFYTSPVDGQGKDLAFKIGGNALYNIPQFKQGFDLIQREMEAMAGKRNISVTNFAKMLASDDESKLSQEEITFKEKVALFIQVANTYLTIKSGTTVPFSKPFIESAKSEIKNSKLRGIAPELYKDLPDMKPIDEVKLFVPNVNPGTNTELTEQATDLYSKKIGDRYNELLNMQPRKRAAELMNIYNQSKVETLINNGFTQYRDVEDDLDSAYSEDNYEAIVFKNVVENRKNALIEQNIEALENSDAAGQQAGRIYLNLKAQVEARRKLNIRGNIDLEKYKNRLLREVKDNTGKVIKYEALQR